MSAHVRVEVAHFPMGSALVGDPAQTTIPAQAPLPYPTNARSCLLGVELKVEGVPTVACLPLRARTSIKRARLCRGGMQVSLIM